MREMDVEMHLLRYYMAGRGVDVMMSWIDICEGSRFGEKMDVEDAALNILYGGEGS